MARLHNGSPAVTVCGRAVLSLIVVAGLLLAMMAGTSAQNDKPTVSVGSKQFVEQLILGELLALLLEQADYEVERNLGLAGTNVVHEALINGEVDTYVEY